ncbi:hypothetical protein AK51_30865 [Serratia nematodiphila DZ0503SBS1]|nr:hypothetical protein AK51_30865 [Serratia nematodiphila DZ0503SBS1]
MQIMGDRLTQFRQAAGGGSAREATVEPRSWRATMRCHSARGNASSAGTPSWKGCSMPCGCSGSGATAGNGGAADAAPCMGGNCGET